MLATLRDGWDRFSIYLPVLLMALLALGTYWLVRNAPTMVTPHSERPVDHDPDYFMRDFSVKTFDASGRLKTEIQGEQAWHFPDTDTLEIDKARIRSLNEQGHVTLSTANRALSNADGSEVQLFGNAIVVRESVTDKSGRVLPRMELRSEFLHAFSNVERVRTHLPVVMTRGSDRFTGDRMDYDNLDRLMQLDGRVRGMVTARPAATR
ncbi:LPS export ABC transporter periplasmic protein LptC [Pseudorhodoferax sp. Leaf267]|uniref:LPS export ABC transporter periplasmic protein LptC n=1 Tax=Pseudorhodoferax sp. Leaf267 TaxID=1736316 RepID=UPI0006FC55ED|nr:LPS export ABC transporter periplasmic protein LptC [Pseudorhodoferax sp. Leaf267]KQP21631.1 LPS export ABC transporter periplasmic protein LptC [Pseudorhodoferax sp. Leaf267]